MKATITRILAELDGVAKDASATITLWSDLYPPGAVEEACGVFSAVCEARVDASDPARLNLTATLRAPAVSSKADLVGELLNAALIAAVQRLGTRSAP